MDQAFDDFTKYNFIAIYPDGRTVSEVNPDDRIETASSVKSPLANVALRHAFSRGVDIHSYTMMVGKDHIPLNATTGMQDALGASLTLGQIVEETIVRSDATTTNMIIDFIGGRDTINEEFGHIGLSATRLLQEKLDFEELKEPDQNPIFGESTVRQLASYYHALMNSPDDQPWTKDFIRLHGLLNSVRFFSTKREFLLPHTSFLHKTGSIFSTDIPQVSMVDAGKLTTEAFPGGIFVAAALATYRKGGLRGINMEFSARNCDQLGIHREDVCNHPLPENTPVAA